MKLASRVSVVAILYVSLVGAVFAAPEFHAGSPGAGHTKRQAERNLLRVTAEKLGHQRLPDLVDARTGLLNDNVRSICSGRGRVLQGKRFSRFACILRPWPFDTRHCMWHIARCRAHVFTFVGHESQAHSHFPRGISPLWGKTARKAE
jgi:hypothetical protein